jgi:hypothetical protein
MSEQQATGETFTELVTERKTATRRSYDELAKDSGGAVGRSRWQDYGSKSIPLRGAPTTDNIRAIALGLRVPTRRVWLAIGRELDLYEDTGQTRLASRINPEADLLSRHQEDLIAEFVDELVAAQKAKQGVAAPENDTNVRSIRRRAARRTTGTEGRGPRGGAKNS